MSENPFGLPVWVGPDYRESGLRGVRLLVLADKEPERGGEVARVGRGLDCALTRKYIDGSMPHREFTDVARLVLGRAAARAECEDFWRAVAFANPAGPSAGTRKRRLMTEEDWELTRRALSATLADLEPHALLVFGDHLLSELRGVPELSVKLDALATRTAVVEHPGVAGFSFRDHLGDVKNLGIGDASQPAG